MYKYIEDPRSGYKYAIDSKTGQKLLAKYLDKVGGYYSDSDSDSESRSRGSDRNSESNSSSSSYADSFKSGISSMGSFMSHKKKEAEKKYKDYQKQKHDEKVALKTREYEQAFEQKKPKLLQYYVDQIEKYDDKDYQDAVIRDGCQTAWFLISNLGNLKVDSKKNVDYKCQSNLKKREERLKKRLESLDQEKKAMKNF